MRIYKAKYVLKQAGIIANIELQKHLKPYGCATVSHTPGFWEYKGRDTMLTLFIDYFLSRLLQKNVHITSLIH